MFRPLVNMNRIARSLKRKMNFETTFLADKHLAQVLEVFSGVRVLVGEFGAGLGNLIFLSPNSHVVEIRGPLESNSREYEFLARTLGHRHSVLKGSRKLLSKHGFMRGPYRIKVSELLKLLS